MALLQQKVAYNDLSFEDRENLKALYNYNELSFPLGPELSKNRLLRARFIYNYFVAKKKIGVEPRPAESPVPTDYINYPLESYDRSAPSTLEQFLEDYRQNPRTYNTTILGADPIGLKVFLELVSGGTIEPRMETEPIARKRAREEEMEGPPPTKPPAPTQAPPPPSGKEEVKEAAKEEAKKRYSKKSRRRIRITPAMFMIAKRNKKIAKQMGLIPRKLSAWQRELKRVAAQAKYRNPATGKVDASKWPQILEEAKKIYRADRPDVGKKKRIPKEDKVLNNWQLLVRATTNEYKKAFGKTSIGKDDFRKIVEAAKKGWVKGVGLASGGKTAIRQALGIPEPTTGRGLMYGRGAWGGTGRFGYGGIGGLDDYSFGSGLTYGSALFY